TEEPPTDAAERTARIDGAIDTHLDLHRRETPPPSPAPKLSSTIEPSEEKTEEPKEEPKVWEPIDTRSMSASERENYLNTLTPEQSKQQFQHNIKLTGASQPPPAGTRIPTPEPTDAAERITAVD
ncbi:MAG: hypothetical protein ACKO96_02980, partial [Flammeovirgaceae bacterium]